MKKKPATKAARSIEAKVELTVYAPQKRVWEALVNEATHWWPSSFYSSEKTKCFTIEPRLGGRVFEDFGRGEGFTWYTVNGVESPSSLSLVGFMGPPFGGPMASLLRIELSATGPNETKLEITDGAFGEVDGADVGAGWRQIFNEGFKVYVESAGKKTKRA